MSSFESFKLAYFFIANYIFCLLTTPMTSEKLKHNKKVIMNHTSDKSIKKCIKINHRCLVKVSQHLKVTLKNSKIYWETHPIYSACCFRYFFGCFHFWRALWEWVHATQCHMVSRSYWVSAIINLHFRFAEFCINYFF